jgi:hypothetical protein
VPVRTAILYLLATSLAPAMPAQSIDRAKQLFDAAKYAEAKTERRGRTTLEHYQSALTIDPKSPLIRKAMERIK